MLDIKGKVNELTEKIKGDPSLGEKFKKDPIKTVEGILGVDLPDEAIKKIIDGIKEKLSGKKDGKEEKGGIVDSIKKIF